MSCDTSQGFYLSDYSGLSPTPTRSAVFDAAQRLYNLVFDANFNYAQPDISFGSLPVNNIPILNNTLLQPTKSEYRDPAFNGETNFDFESAAYRAANSTIEAAYNVATLAPVNYSTGREGIWRSVDAVAPPPLAYPQAPYVEIPEAVIQDVVKPVLELGKQPDLQLIPSVDLSLPGVPSADLARYVSDFSVPDVSELVYPERIEYTADADLIAKIKRLIQGDDELLEWVNEISQQKLEKVIVRHFAEDVQAEINKVLSQAAARGFCAPVGFVDAQVIQLADKELRERLKVSEKVRDEIFQSSFEVVARSIASTVAIEKYHLALYLKYVRQVIETYKLNLSLAVKLASHLESVLATAKRFVALQVDAYNALVSGVEAYNSVQLDAIKLVKAQIDTLAARVEMYATDIRTASAKTEVDAIEVDKKAIAYKLYESKLRGVLANIDIAQQNVAAYSYAVDAYGKSMAGIADAVSAYEKYISAQMSKISVDDANISAYKKLIAAERDRLSGYEQVVSKNIQLLDDEIASYKQAIVAEGSVISNYLNTLEQSSAILSTYYDYVRAVYGAVSDYARANVSYTAGKSTLDLLSASTEADVNLLNMDREAILAALDASRRTIKARTAGALSQAASSVVQVGTSLAGSVDESVSGAASAAMSASTDNNLRFSSSCEEVIRPATG